jgi:hypothetical protein
VRQVSGVARSASRVSTAPFVERREVPVADALQVEKRCCGITSIELDLFIRAAQRYPDNFLDQHRRR